MTSVSLSTHATQISGLRNPTTTSLLGSLAGGNESARVPEISGPVTIAPDYTISNAFRANLSTTTVSASNGAVLIYSMRTFSDLANMTGTPILIQTTVPETLSNGNRVTYRGGIWIASGGRYWFPPGIPKLESGGDLKPDIEIKPPCILPFCSGEVIDDGGGGGDPEGDPPPPYKPPADDGGEEPDQETQDVHTQTEVKKSRARSQSAQETTDILSQTISTSLSSSSVVSSVNIASSSDASSSVPAYSTAKLSSVTMASPSNVSSIVPAYSTTKLSSVTRASSSTVSSSTPASNTADLTDGSYLDYNLSIADAIAAALNELPLFNAITVPNGILWVPTGSQELAYAAQATSSFDPDLPTFANFTQGSSLSLTAGSTASQIPTGFRTQPASLSAALVSADASADAVESGIAAIAFQTASSSAATSADQPRSSSHISPAPTPPPTKASESSSPTPPAPTPFLSKVSPISFLECTQL